VMERGTEGSRDGGMVRSVRGWLHAFVLLFYESLRMDTYDTSLSTLEKVTMEALKKRA